MEFYKREVWRKMKFRQFSYGKKSLDKFLNKIQSIFGKNVLIAYGNWSRSSQMKHHVPTLGKGLRKLINKRYSMVMVNEYNTSKKCCKCSGDLEHHKDNLGKKIFRLLKCSNCVSCENKRFVFRTRDLNSSLNIMKLAELWITKQYRPEAYKAADDDDDDVQESAEKESEYVKSSFTTHIEVDKS
jgi:hypothetical protein